MGGESSRRSAAGSNRWPVDPILYPDLEPGPAPAVRYDVLKRVLDATVSVTLLIVLSPLLLLIAALDELGFEDAGIANARDEPLEARRQLGYHGLLFEAHARAESPPRQPAPSRACRSS